MNLLLLSPEEVRGGCRVVLDDRRASHLRRVLRVAPGAVVRIGVIDGPLGEGVVEAVDEDAVVLTCRWCGEAPPRSGDTLLLAIPRPKVLLRCLEHAAALGFGRIVLFRSWRVEPGHLAAKALAPQHYRPRLLAGLEQGRRTHVPEVLHFDRFKPFVEDRLEELVPAGNRFVAHPGATNPTHCSQVGAGPLTLAVGPEGGLIPYEIDRLEQCGFRPVSAGPHPLRVECAVPFLFGQICLLRDLGRDRKG